jgi:flagellar biosynthesis anti-sigma factor FlgM
VNVNLSNDISQPQVASNNVATSSPSVSSLSVSSLTTAGSGVSASISTGSQGGDQATISSASGVLATALNSPGSDVRTARVASLQASINAGTYNIPASSVADKMLSSILGS